ncbi:GNAT family N-acetyltransferase [Ureibacillus aquaedulcis]|uniref:GNAT family N-acetyltransferase n=1 Tax=Ureibacillus aquaedulcis TaxID=3058421 RepID=A0ABT8GW37_9BACL|nr:GNAT family N-acetyltransferase [Ureibacillus sp. BA0131]MDN4495627.1 GNAT family N-acetyltransferase [Ureibacillus sp. BA0131]
MMQITFTHIHRGGKVIPETEEYKQIHEPDFLSRYDSNLITWKCMPTVDLLKEAEGSLRDFNLQTSQKHLKFIFPPNEKLTDEIQAYLSSNNYSIGFLELYSIQPNDFSASGNAEAAIQFVTREKLEDFLHLQFNEDLQFGENFAKEKQTFLRNQYTKDNVHYILAYDQAKPVGSVILFDKEDTTEIDNLFVLESYQRKGIGSAIQHFIMKHFHDKTIILVADGEDTPREMYQRQNYCLEGFQYEALKVEE